MEVFFIKCCEAFCASRGGTASNADLGGSSKYSSEILEDRGGERFHGNSSWPWVNRSLDIGETHFQIRKCVLFFSFLCVPTSKEKI